jgi:bacteriocin-like protein
MKELMKELNNDELKEVVGGLNDDEPVYTDGYEEDSKNFWGDDPDLFFY